MAELPKVSIVVPVYNTADFLRVSGRQLLRQAYSKLELILVDDGSTDDTWEVCQELAGIDPRVKAVRQSNQGAGPARNTGIALAEGKYLYCPDSDDTVALNAVSELVRLAEEAEADLVVCGYREVSRSGDVLWEKKYPSRQFEGSYVRSHYHLFGNSKGTYDLFGGPCNKLYSLELIRKYGLAFPSMRRSEDEVFNLDYLEHAARIIFTDQVFYDYFINDLDRLWKKYPEDYFELMCGMNAIRCEHILRWTKGAEQKAALENASRVFEQSAVIAMQNAFNPGFHYSPAYRCRRLKAIAQRLLRELPSPGLEIPSVKYKLAKGRHYWLLYLAVYQSVLKTKRAGRKINR